MDSVLSGYQTKHIAKFYSKLDEFRNLEKYADYTIVCEQTNFRCHRVALASACPYFDTMFSIEMMEKNVESVTLPGMSSVTFEEVLRFIYTGTAAINTDNIYSLIVACDFSV